jgi:hypothetical protein
MLARRCANFLVINQPFLSKLRQVFVVELVCQGQMDVSAGRLKEPPAKAPL